MGVKKKKTDQTLILMVTIFVVGLVISRMLYTSFYNTPKVSARNIDIINIEDPSKMPIPPKARPDYMCPNSGWIDCMPSIDGDKTRECTPMYMDWVKKNCPGFNGIAY